MLLAGHGVGMEVKQTRVTNDEGYVTERVVLQFVKSNGRHVMDNGVTVVGVWLRRGVRSPLDFTTLDCYKTPKTWWEGFSKHFMNL